MIHQKKFFKGLIHTMLTKEVTKENLKDEKWKAHIQLLTNFWSAIALGDTHYNGNPFAPHIEFRDRLSVKAFEQWLKLFFEILNSIYEPQLAQQFLAQSKNIAGNFIRNLQLS